MDTTDNWIVLLVSGSSGTRKSTLARVITSRCNTELGRVDDYRMALQSATKPEYYPELHFFISSPGVAKPGIWKKEPEALCDALIRVGRFVSSTLEVVISHHMHTGSRIVLEGDWIIPEIVSRIKPKYNKRLRSVFLYEPDKELFFNIDTLEEETNKHNPDKTTIRTMHWLYNRWLVKEAEERGLPIVQSRPWETLYNRTISAIE